MAPRQQYPGSSPGPETWQVRVRTSVGRVRSDSVETRMRNRIQVIVVCGTNFYTTDKWQKPGTLNERAVEAKGQTNLFLELHSSKGEEMIRKRGN